MDFPFLLNNNNNYTNSLGATRAMMPELTEESAALLPAEVVMRVNGKFLHIERPKLLIRNFLLIK